MLAAVYISTAVLIFAQTAEEKEKAEKPNNAWTYGVEADFNSIYIWRSLAWSQGAVMQPSIWAGKSGFSLSVWGNFVLNKEANQGQFNEFDFRLSYQYKWGSLTLEPAVQFYAYLNQPGEPTTGELSFKASYDLAPFAIETTHYFDFMEYGGAWVGELGLEYHQEITSELTLDAAIRGLMANSKFNEIYIGWRKTAVNSIVAEISLTYNLTDVIYIRPHFEWNKILDTDLRSWVDKPNIVNFGIAIGIEY